MTIYFYFNSDQYSDDNSIEEEDADQEEGIFSDQDNDDDLDSLINNGVDVSKKFGQKPLNK